MLQEQGRSLRIATKTTEQLQTSERSLNDEIERLRSTLEKERNHLATVQVRNLPIMPFRYNKNKICTYLPNKYLRILNLII